MLRLVGARGRAGVVGHEIMLKAQQAWHVDGLNLLPTAYLDT